MTNESTDLPYDVHTGRELEFMLERRKPMACFADAYSAAHGDDEEVFPVKDFAPHVANGTFQMRDYVELLTGPPPSGRNDIRGVRRLFYARPSEAWRIDAYIQLLAVAEKAGWSEGFERLEGRLLGYEDWQIDAHLDHLRRGPHAKRFYWLKAARN